MNNQNHIQFLIENIDNACIIIDENLGIKNLNGTGKQFFEESVGINLYEENNLGDYLSAESKKKLKKLVQQKDDFPTNAKVLITFSHLNSISSINSSVRRYEEGKEHFTIIILETNFKTESKDYNSIDSTPLNDIIVNNTSDSIVLLSHNHSVLTFNKQMRNLLKFQTNKEIKPGVDYREFIHPDFINTYNKFFKKAIDKEIESKFELKTQKDQSYYWHSYRFKPFIDKSGNNIGVLLIIKDVTINKLVKLNLLASENRLKKIIEFFPTPIILLDKFQNIVVSNNEANTSFNINNDTKKTLNDLLKSSIVDLSAIEQTTNFIAEPEDLYMFKKESGELNFFEAKSISIEIDNQEYSLLTFKDLTPWYNFELSLNQRNKELFLLSSINDTIIRTTSRTELFKMICDLFVTTNKFDACWTLKLIQSDSHYELEKFTGSGDDVISNKIFEFLNTDILNNNINDHQLIDFITNKVNEYSELLNLQRTHVVSIQAENGITYFLLKHTKDPQTANLFSPKILIEVSKNISMALISFMVKEEQVKTRNELQERNKELKLLYLANGLLQDEQRNVDEIIKKLIELIPPAYQNSKDCSVRFTFNEKIFKSEDIPESNKVQEIQFNTIDGKKGAIEVFYPDNSKFQFLIEEQEMLTSLANIFLNFYHRKLAMSELKRSESNLKSIYENTTVGHVLIDQNLFIQSFNSSYANFNFINKPIELGKIISDSIVDQISDIFNSWLEQVTLSWKEIEKEIELEKSNTFYNFRIIPIIEESKISGYSISVIDVSKSKSIEIERKRIIDELLEKNQTLEQFSYIVSHNLRSPVATIKGFTQLLNENLNTEERSKVVQGIIKSAENMDMVVNDLNEIIGISKGLNNQKSTIDFKEIVNQITEEFSGIIDSAKAMLICSFEKQPTVYSVRSYIHSIFHNLISNSLKYCNKNTSPVIQIKTWSDEDNVYIEFSDNGIGINLEKYSDQIFGLYRRLNTTTEGKGIGLFLVKSQVEALQGKIAVESQLNVGTKFSISLKK